MSQDEAYSGEEVQRVEVPEEVFLAAVRDATQALESAAIGYGLMGALASAIFGRPRLTLDIDLFVRQQDAKRAQQALEAAGFESHPSQHNWLLKSVRDRVLIDLIFSAKGGIYLDEQMLGRLRTVEHKGLTVKVVPPEDLVVMKAIASDQDTPRYWHDALGIIATTELDWDYLVQRARIGPRRVLSLLLHAQADDMIVPDSVIQRLYQAIYEEPKPGGPLQMHRDEAHMISHLRERFAEDRRVAELNIETLFEEGTLVLRGRVTTPERREAVEKVARELLVGTEIRNDVVIVRLGEDGRAETVA